jgi:hypothetical protein
MEADRYQIAETNFNLLMKLKAMEKVMISNRGELLIDERIMKGVRRKMTGDSRQGLLSALSTSLIDANVSKIKKLQLISHLKTVLKETYPDDHQIPCFLSTLSHQYNFDRVPNEPLSEMKVTCESQRRLVKIKDSGRISSTLWSLIAIDRWIAPSLCDFIEDYPIKNAFFDLDSHIMGTECCLSIVEPDFGLKKVERVKTETMKRMVNLITKVSN